MPTPPPALLRAGRRRVLLGGLQLGAVAVAGAACSTGSAGAGGRPGASPSTAAMPTARSVDADAELVEEVVAAIAGTRALVMSVRRRRPGLADALAPLVRAHAAHGRALGDLPAAGDTPEPARGQAAALAQVVSAEQRLQERTAGATLAARSGTLAAVLGSVTASLAQHLAALGAAGAAAEAP